MRYPVSILFVLFVVLNSCELFTIGSDKPRKIIIEPSQKTAIGAIYLFKQELDSNNIPAAAKILMKNPGLYILAVNKYELYEDLEMLSRQIFKKEITHFKADTLNPKSINLKVEFDLTKYISFSTVLIQDKWYIVDYK